jgi:amino acid transporter
MAKSRKLTLFPLIAATYLMVAGGPFGLEDIVSKSGYTGAILILLVTPVIWSLPTALMVSELASAIPEEGGYYVWVTRAMGRFWGYQEAWLSLAASVFDMAIYPTLFVGYLGHLAPWMTAGGRGFWVGVALIAVMAAWNLLGARAVGGSSLAMTVALLSPFFFLMGYALLHRPAAAPASTPLSGVDFLGGIVVAMWNYQGWDDASPVAGEVDRPQRTYPLAMMWTTLIVALTYVLPIAGVAAAGIDANRWTTSNWPEVARSVMHGGSSGAVAAVAVTVAGMVGAAGTLNALTMSYSRIPAVLAEDGFLPRIFARTNAAGAPAASVVACAAAWALCLKLSFTELLLLDVLLKGLSIVLEFAALAVLRVKEPNLTRPYRLPGGMPAAILIGVPPTALLVITAMRSEVEPVGPINSLELGAILIALGVVLYWVSRRCGAGFSDGRWGRL